MPIFQDPDRQRFYDRWSDDHPQEVEQQDGSPSWVRCHEDSKRPHSSGRGAGVSNESCMSSPSFSRLRATDREELIRYIKSADSSAWTQHDLSRETDSHPIKSYTSGECPQTQKRSDSLRNSMDMDHQKEPEELASPADIQRPRSALHSGDFREGIAQDQSQHQAPLSPHPKHRSLAQFSHLSSSPTTPWFTTPIFSAPFRGQEFGHQQEETTNPGPRSRAPSLGSYSSSYVLKAPTSPLVYQANNTDLDFSLKSEYCEHPPASDKASRRRTLPPETFRSLQDSSPPYSRVININTGHSPGTFHDSFSFQARQPRKPLTSSYSLQLASSVQHPSWRARRPSLAGELSCKTHAPLVGSYEESILRGRMSMNPSKPLDFTAQIGVLGKGNCKSNLKCPPHVTVPFPAVFYSYPTSGKGRSISDDSPSPYVGMIDLENSLPKDNSCVTRRRRHHRSPAGASKDQRTDVDIGPEYQTQEALRKREKRNRRADSPKCPPGGCYRIPQQGQLQIMIKNPNKTAVKLFLVPYDLSEMEPGTKTFIRQRSYSAGPIIDMPLSARKNLGTDRPEASLSVSENPNDKPILRYLIHLNICCPSKGRFYLYSSIRVVFANRVPDGKENLRNEIQHPDPRYTPYKPVRDMNATNIHSKSAKGFPKIAADLASLPGPSAAGECSYFHHPSHCHTMPLINSVDDAATAKHYYEMRLHPFQPAPSPRETALSPRTSDDNATEARTYRKLSRGDLGYGGLPFSSSGISEAGESLLAKRLRGLDVQKHESSSPN
ncbi:protein FAM214A [Aspergillus udagawae]|nr:protein FAM214A [Aspergillus udagawae]